MGEPMLQTIAHVGSHQMNRTESEEYDGVQTFMLIVGVKLVEVQIGTINLRDLSCVPKLNQFFRQGIRNDGSRGVCKMGTSELLPYLNLRKDELIEQQLKRVSTGPIRSVV